MRIGELAAATGVSTRALRYYEEHGLVAARRSPGGQRHYPPDTVERVRWIQALFAAGLTSRTVVELLPCVHTGRASAEMVERLVEQRVVIDARVRGLAATRDRLDAVIVAARATLAEPGSPPAAAPAHLGSDT